MHFSRCQTAICNGKGLGQPGLVTLYNIASSDSSHAVWPSGKVLGGKAEGTRFDSASALRSLQKWFMDAVFVSLPTTPPPPPPPPTHPATHTHTHIHSQLMCKGPVEAAGCRPGIDPPLSSSSSCSTVVHHVLFL